MTGSPLFPRSPDRHRVYGGLTPRQEHKFTWIAIVVVLLYVTAWIGAWDELRDEQREYVADQQRINAQRKAAGLPPKTATPLPTPTQRMASAILDPEGSSTAYISD
ncbi:MAG: hypothetical protein ABI837_11510, partial [Acidobacteriota bacterium]